MQLTPTHLDLLRNSKPLAQAIKDNLEDPRLMAKAVQDMTADERDAFHDAALDAWTSEAPIVEEVEAYGAYDETFSFDIHGVDGLYFVFACEFDEEGPFLTVEKAIDFIFDRYGEFLIKEGEDEAPERGQA